MKMVFTITRTSLLNSLREQVEQLNQENVQLKLDNSQLKKDLEDLQKTHKAQRGDLESATSMMIEHEERIRELEQCLTVQDQTMHGLLWSLENLSRQAREDLMNFQERLDREGEKVEHYKKKWLLLEMKMNQGEEEGEQGPSMVEQLKTEGSEGCSGEASAPICEICVRPYDGNCPDLTPRVLECGHSVCEECAGRLAENQYIQCPFDRLGTILGTKGVLGLAKNFTVLHMAEESKKAAKR